jgi:hypothetical protein
MYTEAFYVLATLSLFSCCLVGITIAVVCCSFLAIDEKVKTDKYGYIDIEADDSVCRGYRDVESE